MMCTEGKYIGLAPFLIGLIFLCACNDNSRTKVVEAIVESHTKHTMLLPFPKDSVSVGVKWYWGDGWFFGEEGEERFVLRMENLSYRTITFDSVYEVGAWRNKDSCYTMLYRDTMDKVLHVDMYSELRDTISPDVKDVYRSSSDFSEYLLAIRVWSEGTDTVTLAYHITEPDVWTEKTMHTRFRQDLDVLYRDSAIAYIPIPMVMDVGIDWNDLANRGYVCARKRPASVE